MYQKLKKGSSKWKQCQAKTQQQVSITTEIQSRVEITVYRKFVFKLEDLPFTTQLHNHYNFVTHNNIKLSSQ